MPRAQQAPEARILRFFKDAPLVAATLVLNLAKDVVRDRQAHAQKISASNKKTQRRKKQQGGSAQIAAPATPHGAVTGDGKKKAGTKKGSNGKKKPGPAPAPAAQVDDFGQG